MAQVRVGKVITAARDFRQVLAPLIVAQAVAAVVEVLRVSMLQMVYPVQVVRVVLIRLQAQVLF